MSARAMGWHSAVPGWNLGDDPLAWQDGALCAQADAEAWFPEKGGSVKAPKKICGACPVRADCLEYALENRFTYGIWGGLTERQRRAILADRERAAGLSRCQSGHHVLTAANVLPNGKCGPCHDGAVKGHEARHLRKAA